MNSGNHENSEDIGIRRANVVYFGFPSPFPHTLCANENSENSLGPHQMLVILVLIASPAHDPAARLS